jgi:proline racemase
VLFWHKDGYSTACGHGTIALGAWAVESGRVAAPVDGEVDVTIDVPSGRVVARVRCRAGAVESVAFRNVPAYVVARGVDTWPNDSIVGTTFLARAVGRASDGVLTEVEGTAFRTGEHRFVLDPRDPLQTGFVLR